MHCDPVLEQVVAIELPGLPDMLVDRFQEPLNVFVLAFVEPLELFRLVRLLGHNDRPTTVASARAVGADLIDLTPSLEPGRKLKGIVLSRIPRRLVPFQIHQPGRMQRRVSRDGVILVGGRSDRFEGSTGSVFIYNVPFRNRRGSSRSVREQVEWVWMHRDRVTQVWLRRHVEG